MYPKEQDSKKDSQNEEIIDLGAFFKNIFNAIKYISKLIIKFIFLFFDSLYIKKTFVIICVILGTALGMVYFYISKPFYESSMTLNSNYFNGELLDNSIKNLNEICQEKNTKVLASLLHIPESKAKEIKRIKISPVISQSFNMLLEIYKNDNKYKNKLDSLLIYNNQTTFQLNVEVYDTSALRGLDTILVNYIKDNDYVKKRIQVDRANLVNLLDKLSRESGKLDTLKRSIASSIKSSGDAGRSGTNNVILGEKTVNPIDIYREDLSIYNQKQEIERRIALNAEIEVIEKFIPYAAPKSGSIITNALKGALAGLIIGLLFILFQILQEGLTRLRYSMEG